jgi:hypothetical protein
MYTYAPRPYGVGTQVRLGSLSHPLQTVARVSYTWWQYLYGLYWHAHIFFGQKMQNALASPLGI